MDRDRRRGSGPLWSPGRDPSSSVSLESVSPSVPSFFLYIALLSFCISFSLYVYVSPSFFVFSPTFPCFLTLYFFSSFYSVALGVSVFHPPLPVFPSVFCGWSLVYTRYRRTDPFCTHVHTHIPTCAHTYPHSVTVTSSHTCTSVLTRTYTLPQHSQTCVRESTLIHIHSHSNQERDSPPSSRKQ